MVGSPYIFGGFTEEHRRLSQRHAGLSQALSHFPEVARLVGVEKPKTELDHLLERVGKMTGSEPEALKSALRDLPRAEGKNTG